jgi:hypothetical protein
MRATPSQTTFIGSVFKLFQALLGERTTAELFRTLEISIRSCVLDTNSILSLISYSVRKGCELPLLRAAEIGGVRLIASTTVRDEVPEKIAEKCPHVIHMDPARAHEVWERDFAPRITFVDPSELPLLSTRVQVVNTLDADDVPTGQLIELFGPHAVYSNDKRHLGHFGILGHENAQVSTAYRAKSMRDATVLGVHVGGGLVITLSFPAFEVVARLLGCVDRRLTTAVALVGIAGIAVAVIHPTSRRWLATHLERPLTAAGRAIEAWVQLEVEARRAEQFLIEVQRSDPMPATAFRYASRVLSQAPGPITARELTTRMKVLGYKTRSQTPQYYVARVLRQHQLLFEELPGRTWQLRSQVPGIRIE